MSKFAKGNYSKNAKGSNSKNNNFFLYFSPGNLLIILYQLSKFQVPSCNNFWEIKISMSKFAKGNN